MKVLEQYLKQSKAQYILVVMRTKKAVEKMQEVMTEDS